MSGSGAWTLHAELTTTTASVNSIVFRGRRFLMIVPFKNSKNRSYLRAARGAPLGAR